MHLTAPNYSLYSRKYARQECRQVRAMSLTDTAAAAAARHVFSVTSRWRGERGWYELNTLSLSLSLYVYVRAYVEMVSVANIIASQP